MTGPRSRRTSSCQLRTSRVVASVHLEHGQLPVGQVPLAVEMADPAVEVPTSDLAPRRYQAEAPAEPEHLLLTVRQRPSAQVGHHQPEMHLVADAPDASHRRVELVHRAEALLDDGADQCAREARVRLPGSGVEGGPRRSGAGEAALEHEVVSMEAP
ncbi:hypothetical protein [Friedmanniella luteola]|uniref:hypothetical protein n=1 Tax=Friedmanniella luteola TaxID=546871 RepID=UPI000B8854E0|nr:hypothetical protein [Friedmanniella luteola]